MFPTSSVVFIAARIVLHLYSTVTTSRTIQIKLRIIFQIKFNPCLPTEISVSSIFERVFVPYWSLRAQNGFFFYHTLILGNLYQPFTPWNQFAYSLFCSLYISWNADKENLFNNQELYKLVIISFILMTLMFDSGVIL